MNTLFLRLAQMDFLSRDGHMMWGCGSFFSWGTLLTVTHEGKGYRVRYDSWGYDQYGDKVFEKTVDQWFRRHSDVLQLVRELLDK